MVTVRMLQGMAGEQLTLEPGYLYDTATVQAKLWAEHGVAEIRQAQVGGGVGHFRQRQGWAEVAGAAAIAPQPRPASAPP